MGQKKNTAKTLAGLGICGAVGGILGMANFFYKTVINPEKHGTAGERGPEWKSYSAGRRWMNEHVRRQDVFILSDNGLQLHGNLIRSGNPDCHRYAVCVHGYADSAESVGIYARHYYEECGMTVLLPDLRGAGASEGNCSGLGYLDGKDIVRWVNFILEQDPKAVIILHGVSVGAAAVLMATGHSLPIQVKACIADSAYTDAVSWLEHLYEKWKYRFIIPAPLMIGAVRLVCLVRGHYDFGRASCVHAVRHSYTPTLFIHGEADRVVPPDMMPQLYEAASCRKEFLWIPGAGHKQGIIKDPKQYWSKTERFLNGVSPWILHDNIQNTDPFVDM